jgi:hypothetical protein
MNVSFDLLIDTNLVTTIATIDALFFFQRNENHLVGE